MNAIQKRFLMFLIGCIGFRFLLVWLAKTVNKKYLPLMGLLALGPVIGFSYIYFTNSRNTGAEVFGSKIWWNYMRPIHALLYLIFSVMAFKESTSAWIPLLIDVSVGLLAFLNYHYSEDNFSRLF